jgi:ATP-dependent helicase/DNAse subunit B
MLKIYYARENIDKDRFMYEHIGGALARIRGEFDRAADGTLPTSDSGAVPERVLLIVPEQYTLQAERDAMDAMGLPGFIDFDVLSMTSLGRRVFADVGGTTDAKNFIDQYGKIMLITKLLHEHAAESAEHLKAFRAAGSSAALASNISDMISELKNFNITPSDLEDVASKLGENDLLRLKLADVAMIYRGFERELSGKLRDTADYLKEFTAKIPESGYIASSEIWLSGYDYLSPAMNSAVIELSKKALGVNIVLTADESDPFFSLTNGLADKLSEDTNDAGIIAESLSIDDNNSKNYKRKLPSEISHIEQNLFASKGKPFTPINSNYDINAQWVPQHAARDSAKISTTQEQLAENYSNYAINNLASLSEAQNSTANCPKTLVCESRNSDKVSSAGISPEKAPVSRGVMDPRVKPEDDSVCRTDFSDRLTNISTTQEQLAENYSNYSINTLASLSEAQNSTTNCPKALVCESRDSDKVSSAGISPEKAPVSRGVMDPRVKPEDDSVRQTDFSDRLTNISAPQEQLASAHSDSSRTMSQTQDSTSISTTPKSVSENHSNYNISSLTPSPASTSATTKPHAFTLTSAANFYAEAETVASQICDLLRDENYKYRDVLVLCNDMQTRVPILKRVFGEYGLPVFIDQRRAVEHDPVIELLLALPELAASGRKYEDVFRVLKTGFAGIERNAVERLENYALEYRIRGSLWEREFIAPMGAHSDYTAEEISVLNETRAQVSALFAPFEKSFNKSRSAREKTECLRAFITENIGLPDRVAAITEELEAAGNLEYAAELTAIESVALGVLDQLENALGDIEMKPREYANCLRAGLNSVRIGMLPTSADQIVIGTMQRTRSSHAKAVFVVGANDGVLPSASEDYGILNSDEKQRLELTGNFLGRSDETVYFEEQLAIYRNLSKPSEKLYISYAASDIQNKELRPSYIFNRVHKLFRDNVRIRKDIIASGEDPLALVQYPEEALVHLTDNIRNANGKAKLAAPWQDVMRKLQEFPEYRARIFNILPGLNFNSGREKRERISRQTLELLMNPTVSPSAIERYSRCPFSWFVGNALRLSERRVRELDYRGIGDVYHELLMRYGERINSGAKWDSVTREDCGRIIRETYEHIAGTYKDGLLGNYAAEGEGTGGYMDYRKERITRVAEEAAWAITNQVRDSNISKMLFESAFGRGAEFAPIEIDAEKRKLSVSGRIDRVDIIKNADAVITDYKSGSEKFSPEDIRGGWQLQLIIYLLAVTGTGDYSPGGINYLGISEPHIEDTGDADKLEKAIAKEFKPDGLFATNADSEPNNEKLDELNELMGSVRETLETVAMDMLAGKVRANPMTAKKITAGLSGSPMKACTYCGYKGICGYL